jgi:hypothetical protein
LDGGATKGSSAMKFARRLGGSIDIHVSHYAPAYTSGLVQGVVLIASAKVGIDVAHWNVSTAWHTGSALEALGMELHLQHRIPLPGPRVHALVQEMRDLMHHVAIHARPREMWAELGPFLWVVRPDDRIRSRVWRSHWGPTSELVSPAAPW